MRDWLLLRRSLPAHSSLLQSLMRYADDVIVHCRTGREAKEVRMAIAKRLRDCGLELHPEKTKIVYCKDGLRKGKHTNEKFDFLGYEFGPRRPKNRNGKVFLNFSQEFPPRRRRRSETRFGAGKYLRVAIRLSKSCHGSTIQSSAAGSNITGGFTARRSARSCANWTERWSFGPSVNTKSYVPTLAELGTGSRASRVVVQSCSPTGSWHVAWLHDGSRMTRECPVRFCERLGVKLLGATLPPRISGQSHRRLGLQCRINHKLAFVPHHGLFQKLEGAEHV